MNLDTLYLVSRIAGEAQAAVLRRAEKEKTA